MTVRRFCPWVALLGLLLAGCSPFTTPPPLPADPAHPSLPISLLEKGRTVQIDGAFERGRLIAERIQIEEPDDEVTIKGTVEACDDATLTVEGVRFVRDERSRLESRDGSRLADLSVGAWVKAEGIPRGDVLLLRKAVVRERKNGEGVELQGSIERVRLGDGVLWIAGVPVRFHAETSVAWDVAGEEAPELDPQSLPSVTPEANSILRRSYRADEEDRRDRRWDLGAVSFAGEVQYDAEWRNNFDLRDFRDQDRLVHEVSTTLEMELDLGRHLFGFFQGRMRGEFVHFDQDDQVSTDRGAQLGEGWLLLEDLPIEGLALQVGRQDFDHGREWLMDAPLDAVRLYANLDPVILQASISAALFDEAPEDEGVTNVLMAARMSDELSDPEYDLLLWYLYRTGGPQDLSRSHIGFSLEARTGGVTFWADGAIQFGRADGRPVTGYGLDVMALYEIEASWDPYVFAGLAFGSGDRDPEGRDGNFRQTGLHDNNDRLGGVTGYRYLGELFRPELTNLMVFTLGVGCRPIPNTSIDLVFHHYRQAVATPTLPESRLRLNPTGLNRDLGSEFDLILGLEMARPLEIEIVFSWFHPGNAFATEDDAWFATLQIEWNF